MYEIIIKKNFKTLVLFRKKIPKMKNENRKKAVLSPDKRTNIPSIDIKVKIFKSNFL